MTMREIHAQAMEEIDPEYHEFLSRYNKHCKCVYGFVEGKDDPCFYRNAIEQVLPDGWEVELWNLDGKDHVLRIYSRIIWNQFNKKRIAFFVDKDLSLFIDDPCQTDENIYTTDQYAIENEVVNRNTCDRILTEVCNLENLEKETKDSILDLFERQFELFKECMVLIMSWIIFWKRNGKRPCLDNILMKDIFSVRSGKISQKEKPAGSKNCVEYIHKRCGFRLIPTEDICLIEKEFRSKEGKKNLLEENMYFGFLLSLFYRSMLVSILLVGDILNHQK